MKTGKGFSWKNDTNRQIEKFSNSLTELLKEGAIKKGYVETLDDLEEIFSHVETSLIWRLKLCKEEATLTFRKVSTSEPGERIKANKENEQK